VNVAEISVALEFLLSGVHTSLSAQCKHGIIVAAERVIT